jgi:hypothetical protein
MFFRMLLKQYILYRKDMVFFNLNVKYKLRYWHVELIKLVKQAHHSKDRQIAKKLQFMNLG